MGRRVFARTVAVFVVAAAVAQAEPGSRGSDEAERRFRSGQALASRGDFAAACREFDASLRLEPSLGTALNLADCEAHTGKLATAIDRLRDALGRLPRGDDRVAPARQTLADLERRVPRLTLVLAPEAPRGTRVLCDGAPVGRDALGVARPFDAGQHSIVVQAAGRDERRYDVALAEGMVARLVVEPTDERDVAPGARGPGASPPGASRRTAGFVSLGLGTLALAGGVVAEVMLADRKQTVRAHCAPGGDCDATGLAAAADEERLAPLGVAGLAIGTAAAGLGAWLLLTGPRPRGATSVGAAPTANGGAALSVAGTF